MVKRLTWKKRYRVINDHHQYQINQTPYSIDIHNWRVIYSAHAAMRYSSSVDGVFVKTDQHMWFLPGILFETLLNFLFVDKATSLEQFFVRYGDMNIPFCSRCKGSGRLDWVSDITFLSNPAVYIREPDVILQYSKVLKHENKIEQIFPLLYISRTKLVDGEFYCRQCSGTGLQLDARFKLFSGLRKIRYRLKVSNVYDNINEVAKLIKDIGGKNGSI